MVFHLPKFIPLRLLMIILNSTNHKRDLNILIVFLLLASNFLWPHTLSLNPSKIGFSMIKRNQNSPSKSLYSHFPNPPKTSQERFICLVSHISARFQFILAYPLDLRENPSQDTRLTHTKPHANSWLHLVHTKV